MEITQLNSEGLRAFIESDSYERMAEIPITRHRGLSHINNPANASGDVLLLIAFIDGVMAGYLGVLADDIQTGDGSAVHCGWMSCIWVSEHYRGRRIAQQLVEAALEAWDYKLIATEATPVAERLYYKTGYFTGFGTLSGLRLYRRSDLKWIMYKKGRLQSLQALWGFADAVINCFGDLRIRNTPPLPAQYRVVIAETLPDDLHAFLGEQMRGNFFRRNAESLQWMMRYPWILKTGEAGNQPERYFFTATDAGFDFIPVAVRDGSGALCAFLLFAKRSNRLALPYCYYTVPDAVIASILRHYMHVWKVHIFTTYQHHLAAALRRYPMRVLWKKPVRRKYAIAKALLSKLGNADLHIHDGDGDCAFT